MLRTRHLDSTPISFVTVSFAGALAAMLAACEPGPAPDGVGRGEAAATAATPLDPAIMIMGEWDWELRGGRSRCLDMVDRAAAVGATSVAFVPTHGFFAEVVGTTERGTALYENRGYCYKTGLECVPFSPAAIAGFEAGMRACMARAVGHGLDLAVVPHLDDGRFAGAWRNSLMFDPTATYEGYSYGDILLFPLARAIRDTMNGSTRVYFALQGEMGATVFAHPAGNRAMLGQVRQLIVGDDATRAARVQVGLSINFNFVAGGVPSVDRAALRALLEDADFLGLSCYGAVGADPRPADFDGTIDGFAWELAGHGVDLGALYRDGLALHCSEFGIGAGLDGEGNRMATTRQQAAATPYFGIYGEYRTARDPWKGDVAAFRRDFYRAALEWLRGGGRWRVDRTYIWNLDSWDVQGIYPISTSSEGSYRDDVVVDLIAEFNAIARQGGGGATGVPTCADPGSDPDGDGWGWENDASCKTWPRCASTASDPDGDGWGWENDASCRVVVTCVDVPTPDGYTCDEQAAWGKCDASWMVANDWCAATCGRCAP